MNLLDGSSIFPIYNEDCESMISETETGTLLYINDVKDLTIEGSSIKSSICSIYIFSTETVIKNSLI